MFKVGLGLILMVCCLLLWLTVTPVYLYGAVLIGGLVCFADAGSKGTDVNAYLAGIVFVSGVTAIMGFFIMFFPEQLPGESSGKFHMSKDEWKCTKAAFFLTIIYLWEFHKLSKDCGEAVWECNESAHFWGEMDSLFILVGLGSVLFAMTVAVIQITRPEKGSVRRFSVILGKRGERITRYTKNS